MNSHNYKVIFRGVQDIAKEELTLTFKKIPLSNKIELTNKFITELKNLSLKNQDIIIFQNIEEVIEIGSSSSQEKYDNYYVLVYTYKINKKKEGLLIGSSKKKGTFVIGTWPFNKLVGETSVEKFLLIFNNLIKNTHEYSDISLILS